MAAFDASGEPLEIRLDLTEIDPEAPLEYGLVPLGASDESAVEIDLFESEQAAKDHAKMWRAQQDVGINPNATIIRHKNVNMIIFHLVAESRREKLQRILTQL
mgnify:CR=1 FL=1